MRLFLLPPLSGNGRMSVTKKLVTDNKIAKIPKISGTPPEELLCLGGGRLSRVRLGLFGLGVCGNAKPQHIEHRQEDQR